MNVLTQNNTSIVTTIQGTTRDVIKETLSVDGLIVNLLDTAGVRESNDEVEKIGIQRTLEAMSKADHFIFVFDVNEESASPASFWGRCMPDNPFPESKYTRVLNKSDCLETPHLIKLDQNDILVSTKNKKGVDALLDRLKVSVGLENTSEGVFSLRERHLDLLQESYSYVKSATAQLTEQQLEMSSEDLKYAQESLGFILGEVTSDDLLGKIFSSFCIGK